MFAQVAVSAERGRDGRALNEPISDKEVIVDLMDMDRSQYYEQNFTTSKCYPFLSVFFSINEQFSVAQSSADNKINLLLYLFC